MVRHFYYSFSHVNTSIVSILTLNICDCRLGVKLEIVGSSKEARFLVKFT